MVRVWVFVTNYHVQIDHVMLRHIEEPQCWYVESQFGVTSVRTYSRTNTVEQFKSDGNCRQYARCMTNVKISEKPPCRKLAFNDT